MTMSLDQAAEAQRGRGNGNRALHNAIRAKLVLFFEDNSYYTRPRSARQSGLTFEREQTARRVVASPGGPEPSTRAKGKTHVAGQQAFYHIDPLSFRCRSSRRGISAGSVVTQIVYRRMTKRAGTSKVADPDDELRFNPLRAPLTERRDGSAVGPQAA